MLNHFVIKILFKLKLKIMVEFGRTFGIIGKSFVTRI
jgi:hypothetical protein